MRARMGRCRGLAGLVGIAALAAACRGEETIGPDEFHRVGGAYVGPIEGSTVIGPFSGTVWVVLSQSDATLSGTYDFNGDIRYEGEALWYFYSGSGTVVGTLGSGPTPKVTLTLTPEDCADRVMTYEGTYDDGRRQISIFGNLLLSTELCDPLVSIPHRTILQWY